MQRSRCPARPRRATLCAALLAAVILALLPPAADARIIGRGAGGCGPFKEAADEAQDGDAIVTMFDDNEGTNTEGATVTKNLVVEGGWLPPPGGCPDSTEFDTAAEMLAAGFSYGGPTKRAALHYLSGGGPVLSVGPTVKDLTVLYTNFQVGDGSPGSGGGVYGVGLTGARLRFEQVGFLERLGSSGSIGGSGGGMYLEIDGGSRVTIADSQFRSLAAARGGGFEIHVRGGSHLTLRNVEVSDNRAEDGNGGGGRIVLHSGYVTIADSLFSANQASGSGGGLAVERPPGSGGPAQVTLINTRFVNNGASASPGLYTSGSLTVRVLDKVTPLASVLRHTAAGGRGASIRSIARVGDQYAVSFQTYGFTPAIPGEHIHFFFDTVPAGQAGAPAAPGGWRAYGGFSPFTAYGVADRPPGATGLCVVVANPDNTVQQGTGGCFPLP